MANFNKKKYMLLFLVVQRYIKKLRNFFKKYESKTFSKYFWIFFLWNVFEAQPSFYSSE